MNYITHPSDHIDWSSPDETQVLKEAIAITGKPWKKAILRVIFPDRKLYYLRPEEESKAEDASEEEEVSWFAVRHSDGSLTIEMNNNEDFDDSLLEQTEPKVWDLAEELGYEGEERCSLIIAKMYGGYLSLLTHIGDDDRHYHILIESLDADPIVRLATEEEKLYIGYFYVRQEERARRLAGQLGEILVLQEKIGVDSDFYYFAKVKDAEGQLHFLAIFDLDIEEATILEEDDFEGLEFYVEERSDHRYQLQIIQEWMQRYRDAAAKGLSFEGSEMACF